MSERRDEEEEKGKDLAQKLGLVGGDDRVNGTESRVPFELGANAVCGDGVHGGNEERRGTGSWIIYGGAVAESIG